MESLTFDIDDVDALKQRLKKKFNRLKESVHSTQRVFQHSTLPASIHQDLAQMEALAHQYHQLTVAENLARLCKGLGDGAQPRKMPKPK